ncbi:MAG: YfhO family protein [Clostridiales bacterium]|nr:YfhO family protein [Clostridiales bacterium]
MVKYGKLKLFSFLFPFAAVIIIFALMGVYPAGTKTMLTVDLYHQYMPFIYELRAKILGGRSLFYSWNSGLGNEYYAVFANYCASPLNLLCLLFPYKALPVFAAFITAVRAGLASLFMAMFLSHIDSRKYDLITVSFGVAYALSGWFLTDFWNIMWCDAYVLLPLICLGLLKLFTEGNYLLYVVSLAVALISNYYSGYMLCIFLTFFSVVMYFAFMPDDKFGPRSFFASAGRFALGSLIAGAISAVVVIPTYLILQHSSATGDTLPVDFTPSGSLFDFLGRFLVSANPNIRSGMANVACGTVVVLMLPLFFMASSKASISLRKKIGFGFMMLFMYLSFEMRTLNFIWHGFHFPNQIPYRQSYMMSFIAVIIAFMTIRVLKTFTPAQLSAVCVGAGVFLMLYEKFGTGEEGYQQIGLSLLFLIIQSVVLRLIVTSTRTGSTVLEWVLMITMLAETLTASAFTIGRVAEHEGFTGYEFYGKNRRTIHEYVTDLEGSEGHNNFERTELYPNFICDIQSVYDVKGMSIFSSTARESFVKYMRNFGFHNNGINGLRNAGLTRVTASILGIRNLALIQDTQSVPMIFDETYSEGEVTIYDNPDALSVGFMTSDDIINYVPSTLTNDVFVKTNDWIRAMGVQADVYLPLYAVSSQESGMTPTGWSGNALNYQMTAAGSESSYTVTVSEADIGADVYLYADSSKGGKVKIMNGIETVAEYEIRSYQTVCLGTFTGEPLTATITYSDSPAGTLHVYTYELNREGYDLAVNTLGSRQFEVTSYDDTSITGTIDAGEGGFMLLTIPYTEGFIAQVDGQEAELISVQDALCGIDLEEGTHEVVIRYVPAGFTQAAFISLAGIIALAAVCVVRKLVSKPAAALAEEQVAVEESVAVEEITGEDQNAEDQDAEDETPD